MKRTILLLLVSLATIAAFGQGSVTFQNASTISGWNPVADRNVKFGTSMAFYHPLIVAGANVSSNYAGVNLSFLRAALYYAPGIVPDANWQLVNNLAMPTSGSPFATFKNSTSTTAGSWFGGIRTMAGIPAQNGTASLMVLVWDISLSVNPFSPAAQSGLWTRSKVFTYTTPSSPTPDPADFLMQNLESFAFEVPEPVTPTLAGLSAVMLFFFRRTKQDEL